LITPSPLYKSVNNRTLSQHGAKQLKEEEARLGRVRENLADQKATFEKKKQSVRVLTLKQKLRKIVMSNHLKEKRIHAYS
jgi:hypothetical protein